MWRSVLFGYGAGPFGAQSDDAQAAGARCGAPSASAASAAAASSGAADVVAPQPDTDLSTGLNTHHDLTDGAFVQAANLRGLQHAAALEWLQAEHTLRITENDIASPPPPVPPVVSAAAPFAVEPASRLHNRPMIAAVMAVLSIGAVVGALYGPAIASRAALTADMRPGRLAVPVTEAAPSGVLEPEIPAAQMAARGALEIDRQMPAEATDFGRLVYGRFRQASARERTCLARAIYFEARGEPYDGKVAVAQVIMNRARSKKWPATICGVVHQGEQRGEKCQFSYVCFDNLSAPSGESWDEAKLIAEQAVNGQGYLRELEHATHYHTTSVKPVWREKLDRLSTIGSHIFYAEPGGVRVEAFDPVAYLNSVTSADVANSATKPKLQPITAPAAAASRRDKAAHTDDLANTLFGN